MRTTWRSTIPIVLVLVALLMMAAVPAAQAAPETAPAASCGYWYTVQAGQGWYSVSAATGVSVSALKAANPGKVRPPTYWLYTGEQLSIPCGAPPPPPPPPGCGYWYTVQAGQGWYSVSAVTGVSVSALQAANPGKVRPPSNWLYVGESSGFRVARRHRHHLLRRPPDTGTGCSLATRGRSCQRAPAFQSAHYRRITRPTSTRTTG